MPGRRKPATLASRTREVLSTRLMSAPNPASTPIAAPEPSTRELRFEPPSYEVICLACEISAYAPDDDLPLF
jgi:hypothetical protein